jgi:membrane protein
MQSINDIFKELPLIRKLILFAKKFTLPGFKGVPIYNVIKLFFKAVNEGEIFQRAAAISYNFFMALFPGLIVIFTLIPYIPIDDFQERLMRIIQKALPNATDDSVIEVINSIINIPHSKALSIGFLLAVFFATNGFKSIIIAFNSSILVKEDRSFLSIQWVSLVMSIVFVITTIIAIITIIISEFLLAFLIKYNFMKEGALYYLLLIGNWIVFILMILFMVAYLYYLAPKIRSKFKLISPGSIVSTVVIILFMIVFDLYLDNFNKYNVLYGSIGTLLIVLLWIYVNAFILLLGFEINASIDEATRKDLLPNEEREAL